MDPMTRRSLTSVTRRERSQLTRAAARPARAAYCRGRPPSARCDILPHQKTTSVAFPDVGCHFGPAGRTRKTTSGVVSEAQAWVVGGGHRYTGDHAPESGPAGSRLEGDAAPRLTLPWLVRLRWAAVATQGCCSRSAAWNGWLPSIRGGHRPRRDRRRLEPRSSRSPSAGRRCCRSRRSSASRWSSTCVLLTRS